MRGRGGGGRPWLKLFWKPSSCEPTSSLLLLESLKPVTVLPIDRNLSRIIQQGTNYVLTGKIRARILAVNSYRRRLLSYYSHIMRHIHCNWTNIFFRELCKKGLIFYPGTGSSKKICQGLATLALQKWGDTRGETPWCAPSPSPSSSAATSGACMKVEKTSNFAFCFN